MNAMKRNILRLLNAIRPAAVLKAGMVLCLSASVWAQVSEVTNVTSTPVNGSGHDYIQSLNETVNPANGSVSLRLALPTPSGRGVSLPFAFAYDSNGINVLSNVAGGSSPIWIASGKGDFSLGGWSYSLPLMSEVHGVTPDDPSCIYWDNFVFHDPGGGVHALNVALAKKFSDHGSGVPCSANSQLTSGDEFFQAVLNGDSFSSDDPPPTMVAGADGTTYYYSSNFFVRGNKLRPTSEPDGFIALPDYIVDRNGNQIVVDNSPPSTAFSATDTLGRALLVGSGFSQDGDTVSVAGVNSPYTLHWGTTPNTKTSAYPVVLTALESFCGKGFNDPAPSFHNVVTSIVLPNGQSYKFEYDPTYGLLTKITYPSGAYVSYTWGFNDQSDVGRFFVGAQLLSCDYRYGSPVVSSRIVSFDGQTAALRQDFTYSTTWFSPAATTWTAKTTRVTTTDLVRGTSLLSVYTYSPMQPNGAVNNFTFSSSSIPVENTVQHYADANPASTPLRTVFKSWFAPNLIACELNTLENGLISGTFYQYTILIPRLMTNKKEYDYGAISDISACNPINPAPPGATRETVTTYQSFAHAPFPILLAGTIPIFRGDIFAFQPNSIVTKDASGAMVAQTDYGYDEVAVTPTANVTAHDYVGYGSSNDVRGNATTITSRCFPQCVDSVSTNTYDDTGRTLSVRDQYGNTLQYSYSDNFTDGTVPGGINTNAFVTMVAHPQTISSGQTVSHVDHFAYAYSDGKLTSATDQNGRQTLYSYDDPLRRLTLTSYADGGSTTNAYNDTILPWSVTTTEKMDGQRNLVSTMVIDGMGRNVQTRFESDPDGTDYVDVTYDGLGRKMTQTQAYRGQPTGIVTQYKFDALDRITDVINPDGSASHSGYSGNCATTTDEAGVSHRMCTDGLGRLLQVVENPDGAGGQSAQTTSYSYDTFDKLVRVTQGAQQRFFMYDSLGRVIREKSAETRSNSNIALPDPLTGNSQWSTAYSYDGNNNLTSRTDARDITTSITYDALKRELSRSYVNDPTNTPAVTHVWDVSSTPGAVENGTGRIVAVQSASGIATYDGYSPRGWVKQSTQVVDGQPFVTQYVRDLAGHLTSETYPSGRTVTIAIDAAGRISSLSGQANVNGSLTTPVPYADTIAYGPHGGITSLRLGNGLWEHTNFDPLRLQANEIGVGTTQGGSDILKVNYDYGSGNNNGNIRRQVLSARLGQASPMVVTQLARYDAFNRLISAQEVSGDVSAWQPVSIWEQDLTYDAYGNRSSVASLPLLSTFAPAAPIDASSNQLSAAAGFQYDAAGNLTQEPLDPIGLTTNSYTYDAENRMITVNQNGSTVTNYQYDGNGKRIRKTVNGQVTTYIYDASGNLVAEYAPPTGPGGLKYLSFDIQGSTRLVTAADQSVTACYDFMPFGELIPQGLGLRSTFGCYGPPGSVKQLFTGQERDTESGLDFFGARYMASFQGRFNSPDPVITSAKLGNPQTLNRYTYALNNPLKYTDTDGKYPRDQHEFFTFWLATVGGRKDAYQLAKGAGQADNFWNATTGLLGLGYLINYSKHFGDPHRDSNGNLAVRDGILGGFDAHLIEDHGGPHAPHEKGSIHHILSNLKLTPEKVSVDQDDNSFGGFQLVGQALNVPPGDPVYENLEAVRKYLNHNHLKIYAITVNGQTYDPNPHGDWKFGQYTIGNVTVYTYQEKETPEEIPDIILPGENQLEHDRQRLCQLGNPAACDH